MKVIGITGGIGSGKTTVCKIFELLGVPVFYSDNEAKKLYDDACIRTRVVKEFGKKILNKKGRVDKSKLAGIVFSDKQKLAALNGIIHPEVRKKFLAWKRKEKASPLLIMEAAIMVESGAYNDINYLVSIKSPKELKINRLINNKNITSQEAEMRMKEQMSDEERARYSDAVIENDEDHSLIAQVKELHRKLLRK